MRWYSIWMCLFSFLSASVMADASFEKQVRKVVPKLKESLLVRQVIDEVKKNNIANHKLGQKRALEEIKKLDKKWKSTVGVAEFMHPFLKQRCSKYLRQIKKQLKYIAEIFVMDNLGAVVCESDRTSDYWQGDEDKWIKSFNTGKGLLFIDKASFDESTQAYTIQVSMPVISGGKAIGAITVGIDLDKLD